VSPAEVDDDDAAVRVWLVLVDAALFGGDRGDRELQTRTPRLFIAAAAFSFFSLPNLLDDERGEHRALLDNPVRITDRKH
jgi:hypothetical protein